MNGCKDAWKEQIDTGRPFEDASQKMERTIMEASTEAQLLAQLDELRGCLRRATDIFSQMLLTGKIKAIHRELDRRAVIIVQRAKS